MSTNDKAVLVQVADAVTAAIKAGTFGLQFELERSYPNWEMKLEDANQLRVDVVPVGIPATRLAARGAVEYECSIDVGIRKRFETSESESSTGRIKLAEIDQLVALVEAIHELSCGWLHRVLSPNIAWQDSKIRAAYVPDNLKEWRQFTGIIGLTFTCRKQLVLEA